MVEEVLVASEVVAVVDVGLQLVLVQALQVVVLEQLDRLVILEHLDG